MAMGSTGTINVSPEMMNNAISAIGDYREVAKAEYTNLSNTVTGLIPGNFSGSAASGFSTFYANKIEPLTGTNTTDLLNALEEICKGILSGIPDADGVDEKLAEGNNQ